MPPHEPTTQLPAWARHALATRPQHPLRTEHLARLADALGPVIPHDDEQRILVWLADWDQPTVATIASLIRRCRTPQEEDRLPTQPHTERVDPTGRGVSFQPLERGQVSAGVDRWMRAGQQCAPT
jgi:hypothetical protein